MEPQRFPFPSQEMLPDLAEVSSSGAAHDPPCGAGEARRGMETVGWALQPRTPQLQRATGTQGGPTMGSGKSLTHRQVVRSRWASGTDSQGGTTQGGSRGRRAGTQPSGTQPSATRTTRGGTEGGHQKPADTAPPSGQAQPWGPGPL